MQAESLLSIAAQVAGEHRAADVLNGIVRGLSSEPGVALAPIWLLAPGDLCNQNCPRREECPDQTECLHLAASSASSNDSPNSSSPQAGEFARIPKGLSKVGGIAASGRSILVEDIPRDNQWGVRPDWIAREGLRSFVGHPLVHRGQLLGVLGLFSRDPLTEQDSSWLRMFADQAAVAISNAKAFEALQQAKALEEQHTRQVRQVIDLAPMHMFLWEADGSASYGNRKSAEYFGEIPQMAPMEFLDLVTHREDAGKLKEAIQKSLVSGEAIAMEVRLRRHDGEYRWFLYQLYPIRSVEGKIVRWCGVRTDIDEQKRSQDQTDRENLVLREEIDKASMFEEIVGTSPALQTVLARVSKVAPNDSTVLITGETGTGKELIARAIHKRSRRASRAFVSVNCAAIPRDLIASELFGHEKGAFTGALQRRLGRFELAEGGTIFLDEIGELNPETQVMLLRVLQEREFERVGGTGSIRANVRVIAATHRDLPELIDAGTFRSDLFYRINVFPIQVPPLRERKEDIRLLVSYFIDRYATRSGRRFARIDRKTMEHLQSYPWPGNIRELQNVIERSVIVCDGDEFSIDESWLPSEQASTRRPLADDLLDQERERIEAALTKSKGRVSGPNGAASALGMPASTLDSKIKSFKIDKRRYQTH